jgi:mannose-6-phosphate isomerase class I
LILNSTPGAGVYLGLKTAVSAEEFKTAIIKNESVEQFLNFYPVTKGDFISVPAGTIHAIGGGVTLLEVQQASGITYRLWDWGRPGRELHIDKGIKVSDFKAPFELRKATDGVLLKHADFACYKNQSHGKGWFIDLESFEVYFSDKPQRENYIFVC